MGKRRWKVLRKNPVDIVISDLNMTPVSGLEFLHSLRAAEDAELSQTPVVVMSGYGEHEVKDEILAAGGNAFMTKPVKPGGLEEKIVAILEDQGRLAALVGMLPADQAAQGAAA